VHAQLDVVSPWVEHYCGLIVPGGRVLDLACGGGRHARFLADRGYTVFAVDRDSDSLAKIQHPTIATAQMDLEAAHWPIPATEFGLWNAIVVTNYLYRPYLDLLPSLLEDGGILLYETFAIGNAEFGKPSNPDFLLRHGELLDLAQKHQLRVLAYRDGFVESPKPAMVQSLCASRGQPKIRLPLQFQA
jgi:SAM-dependent methyltransferase